MKNENSKILIDSGEKTANVRLSEMKQQAIRMTELIKAFNLQPVIEKIGKTEQAKEFLSDPLKYFEEAIINDCGMTFGKNKPNPEQVASLFNIQYLAVKQKVNSTRINQKDLQYYIFDEASLLIELMPESEDSIRKQCEIYLSNPDDIKEYSRVNKLCQSLNQYFADYSIHPSSMHALEPHLGVRCAIKEGGQGYELKPNIENIKKHLKHE